MVCVKCGRELEQTRCGSCGYEHREGIRLLGIPEESALILSWDNFSAQRLEAVILQREAELLRLRTLLQKKTGTSAAAVKRPVEDRSSYPKPLTPVADWRPIDSAPIQLRERVRNNPEYEKKLKEFFQKECLGNQERKPIGRAKVLQFVYRNQLTKKWNITSVDVEADLLKFYHEHGIFREIKDSVDLVLELKKLYLANGRKMLTDEQIKKFLADYRLTERYGIMPMRVKMELSRIQRAGL